jgi:hypothetical protein
MLGIFRIAMQHGGKMDASARAAAARHRKKGHLPHKGINSIIAKRCRLVKGFFKIPLN